MVEVSVGELLDHLGSFVSGSKRRKIDAVLESRTRFLTIALEDVYQSHNASAVLRSCECFGLQDVHVVEKRNPFTVNQDVAIGASQWLDIKRHTDSDGGAVQTLYDTLRAQGYRIVAATPGEGAVALDELSVESPLAVTLGTEEEGLSPEALEGADERLRIPMFGFTRSFNISVSAALIIRELTRRIKSSAVRWQLSEAERQDLKLRWYRQIVRGSAELEKRYLEKRDRQP